MNSNPQVVEQSSFQVTGLFHQHLRSSRPQGPLSAVSLEAPSEIRPGVHWFAVVQNALSGALTRARL